jgi:hypothetical protein
MGKSWARNRWNTASKPGWSSGAENRQTEQPQEKLEAVNWDSDGSGTENRDQITGRLRHDRTFKTLVDVELVRFADAE